MAERRYKHKLKQDVMTPLLERVNVTAILPSPTMDKLFYECLWGLEFQSLTVARQMQTINLAVAFCHRMEAWRTGDDGSLIQRQLTSIENSLIDKAKKPKEEADTSLQDQLTELLEGGDI